jgi:nitrate reductase delta subunit
VTATLRALSALLTYPTEELKASAQEMREALDREALLGEDDRAAIAPLLAELASRDLYELQERYVDLFDRSRYLSLHLFEHVYGESRDRGAVMVELVARYRSRGLEIAARELPDYLPLYLEYLSQLPLEQARRELGEPVAVIAALARRLEKRASPYAPVLAALEKLAAAEPDPRDLGDLEREEDLDGNDPAVLDRQWQEDPVVFAAALEQRKLARSHRAEKGGRP